MSRRAKETDRNYKSAISDGVGSCAPAITTVIDTLNMSTELLACLNKVNGT